MVLDCIDFCALPSFLLRDFRIFASVKFEKNDNCEIFRNYSVVCVFVLFNSLNDH